MFSIRGRGCFGKYGSNDAQPLRLGALASWHASKSGTLVRSSFESQDSFCQRRFYTDYMGGCQNYGPFLDPQTQVPYLNKDPKRDHNFDNHPYGVLIKGLLGFT